MNRALHDGVCGNPSLYTIGGCETPWDPALGALVPKGGGVWVAWGSFCKAQIPTESTETGSKTALPQWILLGFRRVKKIQKFHLLPRVTYVPTLTYALGAGVVQVGGYAPWPGLA